jgi:alginate O-acetyltransferase complex protein AlgI
MDFFQWIDNIFLYHEESPMLFSRFYFWGFFAVLLIGYCFLYKKNILRNLYLFAFSLFFYYKSGGYFFSLLILSIVVDYLMGILIAHAKSKGIKGLFMFISVLVNIGVLAYFKYTYLIVDTINAIFQTKFEVVNVLSLWSNTLIGTHFDISDIILPVGISFYTFQSLSYTIDVYRGKLPAVKNILNYGFFVTFFPQLVAGPIVRAADFIPQLYEKYKLTIQEFGFAIFLILNGLMKKMIISDYISINFVDRVFDAPLSYTGFENLMAVYGYAIQIYCDFSGYTDIAIGTALLLGFRLNLNFNSPYKADNITDFWRRWHISLSTWLRDYLYISLGGNRKGKFRTYLNLLLTMLLGGLWHGASIRFIIWGGIHGVALALHKVWMLIFPPKKKPLWISHFLGVLITFHLVNIAWIFFRARTMADVGNMFHQIFFNFSPGLIPEMIVSYKMVFGLIIAAFAIHWLPVKVKEWYRNLFVKIPFVLKILIAVLVVFLIYQFKSAEVQPFIYFQF